jgi:capsular exopolysaccharide synthesis family protein
MSRIYEALNRAAVPVGTAEAPALEAIEVDGAEVVRHPGRPVAVESWPPSQSRGPLLHQALGPKLVVNRDALPVAVEQYRRLAASLHELQAERGLKTLMVTSAVPGEGKTLTVANLALTLSESYRHRVLLIDADLRRPFVHQLFGLPNSEGLSDVLRTERMEPCFLEVSEHLSVLPAGHSKRAVADLTTDRMRTLLDQAAKAFDWVLLDAPPIGLMPEAQLLARLARAVLFVIAANSTPHQLVSRALAELLPEWIVGTVLNRVESHCIPTASYYRQYYASPTAVDSTLNVNRVIENTPIERFDTSRAN